MFAVIYSGKVKPDREEEYKRLWRVIAKYFMTNSGALGSCLHKAADGSWIAYSRWPDKSTRDAVFLDKNRSILPQEIQNAFEEFNECIMERSPEICLDVIDDLLLHKAG